MSPSNHLEEAIFKIEEALKYNQCPEPIKGHVRTLIDYVRESLRSSDSPGDETILSELHKLAAIAGMKVSKMTRAQLTHMLAEVIQKVEIRIKSFQRPNRRQKR